MPYIKRKRHTIPGLNTTSTADISFMLLIFFLVTTSMDINKGLNRRMPPIDSEKVEQMQDIDKENVLTIRLNDNGSILVNDFPTDTDEAIRKLIRHFIIERGKLHVLELHIDRNAKYNTYFHLQNLIALSYSEIRNAASKKKFNTEFSVCTDEQKETIQKLYPQRMTEVYD